MLKKVDPRPDFPEMEKDHLKKWFDSGLVDTYLHKNDDAEDVYSFLDGPITANNPMGVHHAWGRSYKDLWQRFHNLLGKKQRFQNGFDCQGLWVEVEVEKELEIRNKKEIENLVEGDRIASIAKFVQMCKDRVHKYAAVQTDQSKRLGYFMDWDNSYFTMSDANNYTIWHFLKTCNEHGWMYKGKDAVPWCPRCETAISQHEMLTEDYKEATHISIFVTLPLQGGKWEDTSLLIWTTTPWTMPGNVAVGVNVDYTYGVWENEKGAKIIFLHKDEEGNVPDRNVKKRTLPLPDYVFDGLEDEWVHVKDIKGSELLGLGYESPFDNLPRVQEAKEVSPDHFHKVVDASELVNASEGTGLLHIAPGAGTDDFRLLKKQKNPIIIELIQDDASYMTELGEFSTKNAKKHPELIINFLQGAGRLHKTLQYTHRYPACWRCKKELVWKVAEEWYISMDTPSAKDGRTYREMMQANAKKINWMPEFGLDRELDWLKNMEDWLISKKNRYWGLALPIYECEECNEFHVVGSKEELKEKAVEGWDEFEGNSPHKPYIDLVKISCEKCKKPMERVGDVGNPWLDAGIVPFSTISGDNTSPLYTENKEEWKTWFPVDFITESFPGQFKNWFYALLAMATALEDEAPFKNVLGFGTLLAEDGRAMHKSWGNSIEFNEGADKIGVDVMRWMYAKANPADNMLFGYKIGDGVRRSFLLMVWNIYRYYVDYALLDGYTDQHQAHRPDTHTILDEWIVQRLHEVILSAKENLLAYDARAVTVDVEKLIQDISTWYIRRSRDRVWTGSDDKADKDSFYGTLHYVLVQLSIVLSPITPFVTEEIYQNLTGEESVHLSSWPDITETVDQKLIDAMKNTRKLSEIAHRARKEAKIKIRQPLGKATFTYPQDWHMNDKALSLLLDELNVKDIASKAADVSEPTVELDTNITPELQAEGDAREIVRSVQQERRKAGLHQNDTIRLTLPEYPETYKEYIMEKVQATEIVSGDDIAVKKVSS